MIISNGKKKKDTQKYNSIPILLSDKEEMYQNVKSG